jgi:hypothetical protein
VGGHSPASQAETKRAIDALCESLCDPNGNLSLRRINPNPLLVFTVGIDPNSPTNKLFLCSFVRHSAKHTWAGHDAIRETLTASMRLRNRQTALVASSARHL